MTSLDTVSFQIFAKALIIVNPVETGLLNIYSDHAVQRSMRNDELYSNLLVSLFGVSTRVGVVLL